MSGLTGLFKESLAGQLVYRLSKGRVLGYPEERPGYAVPRRYLSESERQVFQRAYENIQDAKKSPKGSTTQEEGRSSPAEGDAPIAADGEPEDAQGSPTSHHKLVHEKGEGSKISKGSASPSTHERDDSDAVIVVCWNGPDDPENPTNWPVWKKIWTLCCVCTQSFAIYAGSSIVAPAQLHIAQRFHLGLTVTQLDISLFVAGYGIGPLFLAPLSEIPAVGRNIPYVFSLGILVLLSIAQVKADDATTFMALRFLTGFFGSPALSTGGASAAELFVPSKRARGISAWTWAAAMGPTIGPLLGGLATDKYGYKWTIYPLMIFWSAWFIVTFVSMPETSSNHLLLRRAQRLRRVTGNDRLKSEGEIMQEHMTAADVAKMTLVRPFVLMVREPIVTFLNIYIGLAYGALYLFLESFPIVFGLAHRFTMIQLGASFLGFGTGAGLAAIGLHFWFVIRLEPMFEKKEGMIDPEDRLEPGFVAGFLLPISLIGFGWTSAAHIPWILPIIFSGVFAAGLFTLFTAAANYLADSYPDYAASVLASNALFRASMGAAFPLFGRHMYERLQRNGPAAFPVAWGSTLLGCLCIPMAVLPFVFYVYGPKIRTWSKYAVSPEEMRARRRKQEQEDRMYEEA